MWYLAEIVFAQPEQPDHRMYCCESCNVLFQAGTAEEAYRKAVAWGAAHEADSALKALGVSHLTTIGETLGEGIDICGRFFHKRDVWDHKDKLIPPPEELKAIRWEWSMDRPLGELLTRHGVRLLRQATEERP